MKWFNGTKGFGFIETTSGQDVFVHYSAIRGRGFRSLAEGDSVELDIATEPRGIRAHDVVVLSTQIRYAKPGRVERQRMREGNDADRRAFRDALDRTP